MMGHERPSGSSTIEPGARPVLFGDLRSWALIGADSPTLMASLPAGSVDVIITDPPYGLAFRGHSWDARVSCPHRRGSRRSATAWARTALRLVRPGGHLACFGSPRTFHRLITGIEDAGFEIRDMLVWLHAAGVPKSRHLAHGQGTALKPAYEPIALARAPLARGQTVARNLRERRDRGAEHRRHAAPSTAIRTSLP